MAWRERRLTWRPLVGDLIGELGADGAEAVDEEAADCGVEARDAPEGLRQFVGVVVDLRRRQVGRPEAADQQRQKQVQHLCVPTRSILALVYSLFVLSINGTLNVPYSKY